MVTPASGRVPAGIDDVDATWLARALDRDVTGVRAEQIAMDSGFSSLLYRLHLTGNDVPATVIVKLAAQSEARGAMEMLGGYRRELAFYRDVADRSPLDTPRVHFAAGAVDSADFALVIEDLADWENADHLAGLSLHRAQLCIEQLAGLHAWSLTAELPDEFPSIDTPMARDIFLPVFGMGWQVYLANSSSPVPPAVARFAEQFAQLAPQALDALGSGSMLLHGDIRADNLFFDGERLKIVDFQMASRGVGTADIAYLVSQGLPAEVRRGQDESLVRQYLDHLGVPGYTFADAWRHYRFAVAYLMVLPVITLVGWDALPQRSRALCITLVDRAVATIDDIHALEVFR